MSPLSSAWRKEAITQRSQAKRKGWNENPAPGEGHRLCARRVPACNTLCLAQKLELRPWIWEQGQTDLDLKLIQIHIIWVT